MRIVLINQSFENPWLLMRASFSPSLQSGHSCEVQRISRGFFKISKSSISYSALACKSCFATAPAIATKTTKTISKTPLLLSLSFVWIS